MLQNLTFLVAFLGATGLKAYDVAVSVRETVAISRLVMTQRKRYTYLVLGQLLLGSALFGALVRYGWSATWQSLHEWWSIPVIGWVVVIMNVIAMVSPLLTLVGAIYIYRRPAELAKRVWRKNGGYVFTKDVRQGIRNPRRVGIHTYRDAYGIWRKEYRYDN